MLKEDIEKLITSPRNKTALALAAFQEERLLLHSEAILEKYNLPYQAYLSFTLWWQGLISQVKYNKIDNLLSCPLASVSVVDEIFTTLQKFIDAQDKYIEFKFTHSELTNDYNEFLFSQSDEDFWKWRIIENLKTGICSYVVVDLPFIQTGERPEPYNYFVAPRYIKDVSINQFSGKVEYICFEQDEFEWDQRMASSYGAAMFNLISGKKTTKIISICDEYYRVYMKQESKNDLTLVGEVKHDLGYCPVIDFWKDSIKGTNGINKVGPITYKLSKLDDYLFYQACIDYMNLYGPFPVLITYDMGDAEPDDKTKEINDGLNNIWNMSPVSNSPQTQDPRKSGRKMLGPGSGFAVPAPADASDHNFMDSPMKFVGMDAASVKLANEILDNKKAKIIAACTGLDSDYMNEVAKNIEMISASFRKEETILTWIKGNIERVHRFVTKAKCELRYGKDKFKGCVIDYGRDYMLKDATTLTKEYLESNNANMPTGYSIEIAKSAIFSRFKNNPDKIARLNILCDLEPYIGLSWETIQSLELNKVDTINFTIKANFDGFISRFEIENGDIVEFGSSIEYSRKISIIKQKLKEYGTETGIAYRANEGDGMDKSK